MQYLSQRYACASQSKIAQTEVRCTNNMTCKQQGPLYDQCYVVQRLQIQLCSSSRPGLDADLRVGVACRGLSLTGCSIHDQYINVIPLVLVPYSWMWGGHRWTLSNTPGV
jgi:hypothetical protein